MLLEKLFYGGTGYDGGDKPNKTRNLFEVDFKEVSGDL